MPKRRKIRKKKNTGNVRCPNRSFGCKKRFSCKNESFYSHIQNCKFNDDDYYDIEIEDTDNDIEDFQEIMILKKVICEPYLEENDIIISDDENEILEKMKENEIDEDYVPEEILNNYDEFDYDKLILENDNEFDISSKMIKIYRKIINADGYNEFLNGIEMIVKNHVSWKVYHKFKELNNKKYFKTIQRIKKEINLSFFI